MTAKSWIQKLKNSPHQKSDAEFNNHRIRIRIHCDYGDEYFCRGAVNWSRVKKGTDLQPIEPCKYYIDGQCLCMEVQGT